MRAFLTPAILAAALAATVLPVQAQPRFSSQEAIMTELQKQGPNAYAYGPDSNGDYRIVSPHNRAYGYAPDFFWPRHRYHHRHYRRW